MPRRRDKEEVPLTPPSDPDNMDPAFADHWWASNRRQPPGTGFPTAPDVVPTTTTNSKAEATPPSPAATTATPAKRQPAKRKPAAKAATATKTTSPAVKSTSPPPNPSPPAETVVSAVASTPTKQPGIAASNAAHTGYLESLSEDRAGVPDRYDDGIEWLKSGVRRHPAAVLVGLIFGWTGAWLAFWGAMVGAFLGAMVGLGVSNTNIPVFRTFGLGQSASVVGVFAGVVVGIAGGFLAVLIYLVMHPLALIGSLVAGAIIAAVLVAVAASFERAGLRIRGYRRLSRDEVRRVAPVVKRAADAMQLPTLPRFAMAQQVIPNAWTHMRTIVLTTGLLQTLEDDELEAILVHELNHWRNGDAVGLHCVWAASWPVVLLYDLGAVISGSSPKSKVGVQVKISSAFRWIVAWLIAWPAWVMTKVIIAPLMAASQRRYEYEADAAAAGVGLAQPLISALRKMGAFESGRTGWEAAMTATHPPTELRIEALQAPKPDDWEYQEEELSGPSWAEIRRIFRGVAQPTRQSPHQ